MKLFSAENYFWHKNYNTHKNLAWKLLIMASVLCFLCKYLSGIGVDGWNFGWSDSSAKVHRNNSGWCFKVITRYTWDDIEWYTMLHKYFNRNQQDKVVRYWKWQWFIYSSISFHLCNNLSFASSMFYPLCYDRTLIPFIMGSWIIRCCSIPLFCCSAVMHFIHHPLKTVESNLQKTQLATVPSNT